MVYRKIIRYLNKYIQFINRGKVVRITNPWIPMGHIANPKEVSILIQVATVYNYPERINTEGQVRRILASWLRRYTLYGFTPFDDRELMRLNDIYVRLHPQGPSSHQIPTNF